MRLDARNEDLLQQGTTSTDVAKQAEAKALMLPPENGRFRYRVSGAKPRRDAWDA